nr:PREDICTED: uncharacterized protein LOC109038016 [Bemisia tabaci]
MAAKHPAILPKNAHLTKLIIDFFHRQNLHAGPRLLQSIISQSYWILSARYAIKAQLHKCIICFRAAPRNVAPQMGQLPESRVVPAARCFLKVGADFGGPYLIKDSKRRNAPSHKAYICLFICLATKAIHLELVSDLTTEAFIAALERFTSRRGMCTEIYSDNGSNFKGTNNYLDELYEFLREDKSNEMVTKHLTLKNIKWHFSPPTGSHFGGIWEAGIKSVKFHLKRILGDQKLTFEEFTTLLTRIEAILNSRPLCPISSDVEDLNVLTPAHFLIGGPLLSLPEYDSSSTPSNRLSRWQLLQRISQQYWKQWSLEYLNTLQQRAKWRTQAAETLAVGDLVLIKDENAPSLQWQMGRVIELHPGKDGIVRVASVKTTANTLRRPLVKLFRLPVD